jgi:hypothetical protein
MADQPITPKQEKAIVALLSEVTIGKAAEKADIGERTLFRWLDEPAFAAAYRAARRKATQQAIARLQSAANVAVTLLLRLAADGLSPPAVRLGATSKILDLAIRAVEIDDLEGRLDALEARFANQTYD